MLAGRLSKDADEIGLDARPMGYRPADELLARMAAEPGVPLTKWMTGKPNLQPLIAEYLMEHAGWQVHQPPWALHPRYVDPWARDIPQSREHLDRIRAGDLTTTRDDAILAVFTGWCGAPNVDECGQSAEAIQACAPVSWLLETIDDWVRERLELQWEVRLVGSLGGIADRNY